MSYAKAGAFSALGAGLRDIGSLIVSGRQRDEEERQRRELLDFQRATQYAADQEDIMALPVSQIGSADYPMPADAVVSPTGVVKSREYGRTQLAAQEAGTESLRREREIQYGEEDFATKLGQAQQTYEQKQGWATESTPTQSERDIANYILGARPDVFANVPADVRTRPESVIGISDFMKPATPERPISPSFSNVVTEVEATLGNYPPGPDGKPAWSSWKYGLTNADVARIKERVANREPLSAIISELERAGPEGAPDPFGWGTPDARPPYRGPLREGASMDMGAVTSPSTITPTRTPIAATVQAVSADKAPQQGENARSYAERLVQQGLDRDSVVALLKQYGLLDDGTGT